MYSIVRLKTSLNTLPNTYKIGSLASKSLKKTHKKMLCHATKHFAF